MGRSPAKSPSRVAVIGAGPAGLMAAERLAAAGADVVIYDQMAGPGRKLLMAGRGGLNLTHSEPLDRFLGRYGAARSRLGPAIEAFSPSHLQSWSQSLGQETFVGSSGRIFPKALKASPLLRAWLSRLTEGGVRFALRHRWTGWTETGALSFAGAAGETVLENAAATILALGGASWPRLGSDGGWVESLTSRGVDVRPLRPANCGFVVDWSDHFRERFAGTPLKPLVLTFDGTSQRGEAMITKAGIEGGAIYALSSAIRDRLDQGKDAILTLDLRPDLALPELTRRLGQPRGRQSLSNFLRKAAGLSPVAIGLLHETGGASENLAVRIKALPLRLTAPTSIDRAISTAGGIDWGEVDDSFMLRRLPGVFAAGEMLDWEAPTGGYLLQACFATGWMAAEGAAAWLKKPS